MSGEWLIRFGCEIGALEIEGAAKLNASRYRQQIVLDLVEG